MSLSLSNILNPSSCDKSMERAPGDKENHNLDAAMRIVAKASWTGKKPESKRSLSDDNDLTISPSKKQRTERENDVGGKLEGPRDEFKTAVGHVNNIGAELRSDEEKARIESAYYREDPARIKKVLSHEGNLVSILSRVDVETCKIFEALSDEDKAKTLELVIYQISNKWVFREKLEILRLKHDLKLAEINHRELLASIAEKNAVSVLMSLKNHEK